MNTILDDHEEGDAFTMYSKETN